MKKQKEISNLKSPESAPYYSHLIESLHDGKKVIRLRKGKILFSQGANADAIYFLQAGRVKVTFTPVAGEKIEMGILEPPDFFGEGCLVGQAPRTGTATAIAASSVVKIEKEAMLQTLQAQPELFKTFI